MEVVQIVSMFVYVPRSGSRVATRKCCWPLEEGDSPTLNQNMGREATREDKGGSAFRQGSLILEPAKMSDFHHKVTNKNEIQSEERVKYVRELYCPPIITSTRAYGIAFCS